MSERVLRVPISVASRKGVSWLSDTARDRRVLLTKHGRVDSVVDTAERLDESAAEVRAAARTVVEHFADAGAARSPTRTLKEACAKLGIDPARVSERAAQLRSAER